MMDSYRQELEDWRFEAEENLRKENSWLALAGLFWLENGQNSFGSDPACDLVFPNGPGLIGNLSVKDRRVLLQVEEGIDLRVNGEIVKNAVLEPDTTGDPTELKLRDLTWILIDREDGLGIRLWDNQRPERLNFSGRTWFPIDERYLVDGVYERFAEELDLHLARKNGSEFQMAAQGRIRFHLDDQDLSLLAFEQEDRSLFTLFLDQSSGKQSYPAGRYVVIPAPNDGKVKIDFNRSYNPPCAFTDYATCPLPPAQNKLSAAVLAGEKSFSA